MKQQAMEAENLNTPCPWISATMKASSWPIVRGSIDHAVTCESSISTAVSDTDLNSGAGDAIGLKSKPSLVLRRPSPDSPPCQITIDFAQHREIKQVYVRSTARVYEIYYSSCIKGENEYLCTVRCGVVARNEKLLNETDLIRSLLSSSSGFNRSADEGHSSAESGSSLNEDGWVDVKVPDSARLSREDSSLPKKNDSFAEQHNQDLFEATAEVADADPVLSVTLRLLSVQSGDYIYIDEVYVFADPVVPADMDSSARITENPSGNALMSMLIPTLMQLSKSRMSKIQERNESSSGEIGEPKNAKNMSAGTGFISDALQSSMLNGASMDMSKPPVPLQIPYLRGSPHSTSTDILSSSHIERSLDELASRVAKIEHFCSKFEENLLKPISSMEARLVKIEQQLESFIKSPQISGTSCTRISASEPSYNESESNSMCNDGIESPLTRKWDSTNKDDCLLQESLISPSDASLGPCFFQSSGILSTTVPHLLPSLVVTAPDFSNVDDAEENDTAEAVENSPNECPKKPSSINDALASALAGFFSSASAAPSQFINKVEEAADCSVLEGSRNTLQPALVHSDEEPILPSVHINGGKRTTCISCMDSVSTEQRSPAPDDNCEDKQDHNLEKEGNKEHVDSSVDDGIILDKQAAGAGDTDLCAKVGFGEADDDVNHYLDPPMLVGSGPSEHDSTTTLEVGGSCIDSTEVPDVLHNILNFPSPAVLDFRIPILDVKFSSLEDSLAMSPLEALLTDMHGFQDEVRSIKEIGESLISGQNDLVMIDNEEPATPVKNNEICLPDCDFGCMSSNTVHEVQDLHDCSHASLI